MYHCFRICLCCCTACMAVPRSSLEQIIVCINVMALTTALATFTLCNLCAVRMRKRRKTSSQRDGGNVLTRALPKVGAVVFGTQEVLWSAIKIGVFVTYLLVPVLLLMHRVVVMTACHDSSHVYSSYTHVFHGYTSCSMSTCYSRYCASPPCY